MTQAPITDQDIAEWRAFIGRSEVRRDVLGVETLRRYAAAVGAELDVERNLPPLAHWAFFLEARAGAQLDRDGHPCRGGAMPPVRLPRRMFAASSVRFSAPLDLGRDGELRLAVCDVRHRVGRHGDLVFVDVARALLQGGRERVRETQTIVYRGDGDAIEPVQSIEPVQPVAVADGGRAERWTPGPVDLFRFSAATFNAHRVHYDLPYATAEEGYPGLLVQGPFTAAKLCAFAALGRGRETMRSFGFRAHAPLFAGQPVRLSADGAEIQAIRCDGVLAMSAQASFEVVPT